MNDTWDNKYGRVSLMDAVALATKASDITVMSVSIGINDYWLPLAATP